MRGGPSVNVSVNIQQADLALAAEVAASKVRRAVLESGSFRRDIKRAAAGGL